MSEWLTSMKAKKEFANQGESGEGKQPIKYGTPNDA